MSYPVLRLISRKNPAVGHHSSYNLSNYTEVVIGREPNCQVVLNSQDYATVSRRHATIRSSASVEGRTSFILCDLNSSNGTYLNGQRLFGCQELQIGDRIVFGSDGAEFVFEYVNNSDNTVPSPAGANQGNPQKSPPPSYIANSSESSSKSNSKSNFPNSASDEASLSQLIPILSTGKDLRRKAFLIPGIITVVFVVLMFLTVRSPFFFLILATYLASGGFYFVYRLCGKKKPWWVLIGSAIACILILITPISLPFFILFRRILPGNIDLIRNGVTDISFPEFFVRMFFGAGMLEELLKALPILGFYLLGRAFSSPKRELIGVWEPLDGILIGSASAVGFTLFETLAQYVPETIVRSGALAGLQLLIPRILGEIAGHMAYSGYFGYFIGLSILKPRNALQTLAVGYFTASLIHALWNSMTYFGLVGIFLLIGIGVLSYAFLTAAILKARTLSPSRKENFATEFSTPNE
ncbi:MAG: PrsW family glutamic-type intramembrane protease [Cyanobacteria bacterium P01_A01_bin.45]